MFAALMLILLAGGMNGSFAMPMKRVRGWDWEHTWLAWSFLGMVVLPLAVAAATVPDLGAVYRTTGLQPLVYTALYGMIWGVGTALFGVGIARVGLALSFGIVLGTSSSLGTIIPLVTLHRDRLFTTAGLLVLAGVGIILPGVAACARAGLLREAVAPQQWSADSFMIGLGICLLSGLGSTFMSVALNESKPISAAAQTLGASPDGSLNAVWPVLLGGGFAVNAVYCIFLLIRRGSAGRFGDAAVANIGLVLVMAVLWSGSNFVYGAAARRMGPLGLVLGWPVFMAAIMLMANIWGLLTGEWRSAGRRAVTWAAGGCLLLIVGISVIASAGSRS
jgi:L-rhamnose-H+ transport protein